MTTTQTYPDPNDFPDGDDVDSTTVEDRDGYSPDDHDAALEVDRMDGE